MSRSIILLGLVSVLGACQTPVAVRGQDNLAKGLSAVNVPVVTRADYALDLSAPDGSLSPPEATRLDGWFRSMDLGYGDMVYVDGPTGYDARGDVARVAGQYGMLVSVGAPMTAGPVPQGMVRVVVARTSASVPDCPNWSRPSTPAYRNTTMSNFGCGVNSNLAAMIANPQDLVRGREGSGVGDTLTSSKAVEQYRKAVPTGLQGLKDISTKGN
ncbi:MAG: CpaD family pilus assembly protein [Pseudomonadota bacterium]|nr:CpaD family pilus assembly protein [Pseudomonadota bacterium]